MSNVRALKKTQVSDSSRTKKSSKTSSSSRSSCERMWKDGLKKKKGFNYIIVTIHFVKGVRFGLGIKHFNDQVIVSKSEKGSMCGSQLKVLDHIVEVNGVPVIDKDVCREMLIKSMQVRPDFGFRTSLFIKHRVAVDRILAAIAGKGSKEIKHNEI
ncbi:unnamed protein product [Haemonchus placei]|uniref:PDZ domain-containing protein n=1 Tax=Haemonchus placei TaxID=6290 RepID=A0A0N4XBV5_HAEPC|nr:unnamed protein product [Haemonchus placei]